MPESVTGIATLYRQALLVSHYFVIHVELRHNTEEALMRNVICAADAAHTPTLALSGHVLNVSTSSVLYGGVRLLLMD